MRAVRFRVSGRVQGVGFRYFTQQEARRLGVSGWVRNRADGTVDGEAQGSLAAMGTFEQALRRGPSHGRVERLDVEPVDSMPESDEFEIRY